MDITNAQRTGLFDLLGRLVYWAAQAQSQAAGVRNTAGAYIEALSPAVAADQSAAANAAGTWAAAASSAARGAIQAAINAAQNLAMQAATILAGRPISTPSEAAPIIAAALKSAGYKATPPALTFSVSTGTNSGDARLFVQRLLSAGIAAPWWPTQTASAATDATGLTSLAYRRAGQPASPDWDSGDSQIVSLLPQSLGDTLITGASLDLDAGAVSAAWILAGSQISHILPPQDEIQFSAQPTGGYFNLKWLDRFGKLQMTRNLPYNATPWAVASAIAALSPETADVKVSARTAGPGFVVDWPRAPGSFGLLQVDNHLSGATVSIVRTRAGNAGAYAGHAVRFLGNGSEKSGIFQPLSVGPLAGTALVRIYHDGATAGTLQVGLFAEANATAAPLSTPAGGTNAVSVDLSSLAANQFHFIECPLALDKSAQCYFGIRLSTAMTSGKSLYINWPQIFTFPDGDGPGFVLSRERYGPLPGDSWTVQITNPSTGKWAKWWARIFSGSLLPPTGTTEIPESIIAP